MYNVVQKTFTSYNGLELPFFYREDTNDFNTITSIVCEDEYKTSKITYSPGDTFIDVGAYVGAWSLLMKSLVPESRVLPVEPLPENVGLIEKNLDLPVILENAVAKSDDLKVPIYYGNETESGLHHHFVGNASESMGKQSHEASSISFDSLINLVKTCRVMKIDCEGAEFEFLEGASIEALSKVDYIIGEYHNPKLEKTKTRKSLFKATKGLFEDLSDPAPEGILGTFWFKRKELK